MVTTRSADKRNNTTQGGLTLRSKTAESPSPASSTPTTTRKRAANQSHTPRSKRTRLESSQPNTDSRDETLAYDLATIDPNEGKFDTNNIDEPSNEIIADQAQLIVPPNPVSTTEGVTTNQSASKEAKHDLSPQTQTDGQEATLSTPKPITHKRFDSQESDDFVTGGGNKGNIGTDSSAYQEYQTAEEEIADSDEAPDVTTTKHPSSRPKQAAKRTPRRRKAKNVAKSEPIAEDTNETVAEPAVEAPEAGFLETVLPFASDAAHPSVQAATTDVSTRQPPFSLSESNAVSQEDHTASAMDVASTSALLTMEASLPTSPPETQAETPRNVPPSLIQESSSSAPSSTTLSTEAPQAQSHNPSTRIETAILSTSATYNPSTVSNINNSETSRPAVNLTQLINLQPQDVSMEHIDSKLPRASTALQFTDLPTSISSPSHNTTATISSASTFPNLPRKSRTTLSSHRRALLERRSQRTGGAFRLDATWEKKRRSFVV